jgi:Putative auto-transporter adhesin, head GIN domain
MKKLTTMIAVILFTAVYAQHTVYAKTWGDCVDGNKNVKTENRDVRDFTKLKVGGAFDVKIIKSPTYSLKIEADENIIKIIETKVEDGTLYIKSTENICNFKSLKIYVSMPELTGIIASGASEIESTDQFESEKMDITLSGASEVELNIKTKLLQTKVSGASEVELTGEVDTHALVMSGASELEAYKLVAKNYAIVCSGASECQINVTNELNVEASGASEIKYMGKPGKINKKLTGSSEVDPK